LRLIVGGFSFGVYHPNSLSHFWGAVQAAPPITPLRSIYAPDKVFVGWKFYKET